MFLKAGRRGLNPDIIRTLRDMYTRLSIRLKLPPDKNLPPIPKKRLIPVLKGARQGAVSSPNFFNNYVLEAQDQCPCSLILASTNLSFVCYADDILNLSRTLPRISEIFAILQDEYLKVGLQFNLAKSEIVLFNWKSPTPPSIALGSSTVQPADHIVYLGLPIGSSLRHTRSLLIEHLNRQISASYASIVTCKFRFNRHLLASLFNAVALPHILYIAPFWKIFTKSEKSKICSLFFRFVKYLLRLPPWHRNSPIVKIYKIADPEIAISRVIGKHNRKVAGHELGPLLVQ